MMNLAPRPGASSTVMLPWWASTIFLTMDNPSPAPPLARVDCRQKRLKIDSRFSGGTPSPLSITLIDPSCPTTISMVVPSGV